MAVLTTTTEAPLRLNPQVAVRPEPFGALAYNYDNRRLVFLKSRELVELVQALESHPDAGAAIEAVIRPSSDRERSKYHDALRTLAQADVIVERTP